jgi:hypothetical protein
MFPTKFLVVMAAGLSAAACSSTTTTYERPSAYRISGSEQACLDYGFVAGTDAYNRCVSREAAARAQGRVPVTYTVASLEADARNACYSYGLTPGSSTYNRCVGREIDARRYRDQATYYPATTYPAPATTTTYYASGYPASTTTVTYTPTPAYPPAVTPPAGVEAFRDEYGVRYDAQGNRLDRYGNIISPQSTTR